MGDYQNFFKRENFLKSMKAAKQRKMEWEKEVRRKYAELEREYEIEKGSLSC